MIKLPELIPDPPISETPPPAAKDEDPDINNNEPPLPLFPDPTDRKIEPPRPLLADPDPKYIAPLFPCEEVPVLNIKTPDSPLLPEFDVVTIRLPLVDPLLCPLSRRTLPPVPLEDNPP
jgi:hypothetical protein